MKKKNIAIIGLVLVLAIIGIVIYMGNKDDGLNSEDVLVYNGDNGGDLKVDIAIQDGESIAYLGTVKILDSNPNLSQVVKAINESDEGIAILINEENQIIGLDNQERSCKIAINNKTIEETDISKVTLKKNDGVTLYF